MNRNFILIVTTFILIGIAQPTIAQKEFNGNLLTIDRLFNSDEFKQEKLSPIQWFNNGNSYTILEDSPTLKIGRNIKKYDIQVFASKVLVFAEQLIPEGQKEPLKICKYHWSNDESKFLIFTNTQRVW